MNKKVLAGIASILIAASLGVCAADDVASTDSELNNALSITQNPMESQKGFPVKLKLNEQYINMTAPTREEEGLVSVPIRDLAQAAGFSVTWNGADQSATLAREGIEIWVQIGNTDARVNGKEVKIAVKPCLVKDRFYTTLDFCKEALNLYLSWDRLLGTAKLYTSIPYIVDTSIEYKIASRWPEKVQKVLDENLGKDTESVVAADGCTYLVLTMSVKPTCGYSIEIRDVKQQANSFTVNALYKFPHPDDMVAEMITNPYVVAMIPDREISPDAIRFAVSKRIQEKILSYRIIDAYEYDLIDGISQYIEKNREHETQKALNINNRTYVLITMGTRPSGGYSVSIEGIDAKDGYLIVKAAYHKPGPGDVVTTALTYPVLVVELDDIYEGHLEFAYDLTK